MVRELYSKQLEWGDPPVFYKELAGSSSDSKPTDGIGTGSRFHEADTGLHFVYDEESGTWNQTEPQDDEEA